MSNYLGRIAVVSLTIGVASLALAYAFGGRDLVRLFDRGTFLAQSCSDDTAKASDTERHLAWERRKSQLLYQGQIEGPLSSVAIRCP